MRTTLRVLVFVMVLLAPLDSLSRARPERLQPIAGAAPCRVEAADVVHGVRALISNVREVAHAVERALAGDVSPLLDFGRRLITTSTLTMLAAEPFRARTVAVLVIVGALVMVCVHG
jgi:hypothetical protein